MQLRCFILYYVLLLFSGIIFRFTSLKLNENNKGRTDGITIICWEIIGYRRVVLVCCYLKQQSC